jgi:hypothetical protein
MIKADDPELSKLGALMSMVCAFDISEINSAL